MSAPNSPTPARQIVEAFGDCPALAAMYTEDITWRLNYSLPPNIAGPHVGKEAVAAFNNAVFNKIYDSESLRVVIHDEIGDEASSVVRFDMHATSRRGNSYDVEYVLFAKTRDGLVYEVVELLDSQASTEQHQGNSVGVPPSS
ncbi:MAG: nuclear transport factor 2 family protein [Pseudomonadota bacterium]